MLAVCGSGSLAVEQRSVLYLNSYNLGYQWAHRVTEGVFQGFEDESGIEVYAEFLDAKRFPSESLQESIMGVLRSKYVNLRFDLVLCSDNAALEFALKFRDDPMLSGLPIVFCGISNTEDFAGLEDLYGVEESHDFPGYVELLYRLMPEADVLHVILNFTETGFIYKKVFEAMERDWEGRLRFVYHMGYRIDEVAERFRGVAPDDLVYCTVVTSDRMGDPVNSAEFLRILKMHCLAPVFGDSQGFGREGMVGGPLNDGLLQGTVAAGMAIDLLKERELERKVETRPVVWSFDYEVLQRFGMDLEALPANAVLLNAPSGVWSEYRKEIVIVSGIVGLLGVAVVLLFSMLMQERRHEEELLKAKEKAEQSDRLKSAFLRNISHEIRTPLNAMIGFSNLLRHDTTLDEAAQRSVDHITNGGYILRDTISNILEFSRIESEGVGAEPREALVSEVLDALRKEDVIATWGVGRLEIVDETPTGQTLRVDTGMLSKALAHLVHNGLKFSKERPVTLRCRLEGEEIVFTVEDLGIGVMDTDASQMFLPFRKGNGGAAEFFPGAGLGLSITLSYVERMRGEVTIAPREKRGTKACLKIPVA